MISPISGNVGGINNQMTVSNSNRNENRYVPSARVPKNKGCVKANLSL